MTAIVDDGGFFDGIGLSEITLGGEAFSLPVLYRDASQITLIFPARPGVVRQMMPRPDFSPATLAPGVAALALSVFEYRDTSIGPYNELAVSIPMVFGGRVWPLATLVQQTARRTLHAWVQHLPVTTEAARAGGVEVYGFPKIVAGIDTAFSGEGGRISSELVCDGDRVLALSAPAAAGGRVARMRYLAYAIKAGRPIAAEVLVRAGGFVETWRPAGVTLETFGDHPIAADLDRALLSRRPVLAHWIPELQSVLHAPTFLE